MDAGLTSPTPQSVLTIKEVLQNANFRKNLQKAVMKVGEKLVPEKLGEDFPSPEKSRGGNFEDRSEADRLSSPSPVRVRPLKEIVRNPVILHEANDAGNQSDSESPGSSHGRDDGYDSTQGTDEVAEAEEMSSRKSSPRHQNDSETGGLGQENHPRNSHVEDTCEPTAERKLNENNEDIDMDLKSTIAAIKQTLHEGQNSSQADETSSGLSKSSEQKKPPRAGPASWKNRRSKHADIPDDQDSAKDDGNQPGSDVSSLSHPKDDCPNGPTSSTECQSASAADSVEQKDTENPSEIQVQTSKSGSAVPTKKLPRVGPASWKIRLLKIISDEEKKKEAEANKPPQEKPKGRKRKVVEAAASDIVPRSESVPCKTPRKSKSKATQDSLKESNEPSPSYKPAKSTEERSISDVNSENIQETEYDQVFDLPNKPELNRSNRKWSQAIVADALSMWEEMTKSTRDVRLLQKLMKKTFPYRQYAYHHGEEMGDVIRNFPALQDYRFLKGDLTLLRKASWATLDLKLRDSLVRFNFQNYLAPDPVIAAAREQLAEQSWNEELLRDVQLLCFGHEKTKGKLNKKLYAQRQEDGEPFKSAANTPSIDIAGALGHKDTKISVYCEGHLITSPPNLYEAVMSAYALYWLFNLEYDAGSKKLFEAFDALIGEP